MGGVIVCARRVNNVLFFAPMRMLVGHGCVRVGFLFCFVEIILMLVCVICVRCVGVTAYFSV